MAVPDTFAMSGVGLRADIISTLKFNVTLLGARLLVEPFKVQAQLLSSGIERHIGDLQDICLSGRVPPVFEMITL